MQVAGKNIRYTLYIEGVRVPISSISVTNVSNSGAKLNVDILPIKEGLAFMRGMIVHLFKQINNDPPILKFHGILKSKNYMKAYGARTLSLEIGTVDCRWDTLCVAQFSTRNLTDTNIYKKIKSRATEVVSSGEYGDLSEEGKLLLQNISKSNANSKVVAQRDVTLFTGSALLTVGSTPSHVGSNQKKSHVLPHIREAALNDVSSEDEVPSNTSDIIVSIIKKANNDPIGGLIKAIEVIYNNSNQYIREVELPRALTTTCVAPMPGVDMGSYITGGSVKSPSLAKELVKTIERIVTSSAITAPLRSIVTQILDSVMCSMSIDLNKIKNSIYMHPMTVGYFPPRCNVIFPNMYDTIAINPNDWNSPTRSIITLPTRSLKGLHTGDAPMLSSHSSKTFLCDTDDDTLKNAMIQFKRGGSGIDDISGIQDAVNALTVEETRVGIVPNIFTHANYMLSDLKDEDGIKFANFLHDISKTSVRVCRVSCSLEDDVVVGMPILVLDGDFSIYGVLSSTSYTVAENGTVRTSLDISHPKLIIEEDGLPTPPLWMDYAKLSPDNISNIYQEMFGCGSIYSSKGAPSDSESDTQILRRCIKILIQKYREAKDKFIFTEKFRARSNLTMAQVFEEIYECTARRASDKQDSSEEASDIIAWHGKPFETYSNMGNVKGQKKQHPAVNKQQVVWDYLKQYYNKPGLMAD